MLYAVNSFKFFDKFASAMHIYSCIVVSVQVSNFIIAMILSSFIHCCTLLLVWVVQPVFTNSTGSTYSRIACMFTVFTSVLGND